MILNLKLNLLYFHGSDTFTMLPKQVLEDEKHQLRLTIARNQISFMSWFEKPSCLIPQPMMRFMPVAVYFRFGRSLRSVQFIHGGQERMQEIPLATCFVLSARWNIKMVRTQHNYCGTRITFRLDETGPPIWRTCGYYLFCAYFVTFEGNFEVGLLYLMETF
jgi:hypothetical protein